MLDRYKININKWASEQLESIYKYIALDSRQNALLVLQRISDAIDALQILPNRYEVHVSSRIATRVVHSMPVPPYIVYYRVSKSDLTVEIISVRHGARIQPRRFK